MKVGSDAGRRRIVRAPNHLGDVVMALPALAADGSDVMVVSWLAPLLELAGLPGRVLSFDRGFRGFREAVGKLRREGYREGVLMTPSFSAAWLFRWGGVTRLRGTNTDARGLLLADRIPRDALRGRHRILQYKLLLGQEYDGEPSVVPITPPADALADWRKRLGAGPTVGLFPGSNAPSRRWPVERFRSLAEALTRRGVRVVVLGGPGDRPLTSNVASSLEGVIDAGGKTDLVGLAAALAACDLLVTNDTGPMHLAGAVGTPTVTLWGSSSPAEVRPVGARDARVTGPDLPCKPCFKNHCPRTGSGTLLAEGHEECMRLIMLDDVMEVTLSMLHGEDA
jgi:heptosyltransferase-2